MAALRGARSPSRFLPRRRMDAESATRVHGLRRLPLGARRHRFGQRSTKRHRDRHWPDDQCNRTLAPNPRSLLSRRWNLSPRPTASRRERRSADRTADAFIQCQRVVLNLVDFVNDAVAASVGPPFPRSLHSPDPPTSRIAAGGRGFVASRSQAAWIRRRSFESNLRSSRAAEGAKTTR